MAALPLSVDRQQARDELLGLESDFIQTIAELEGFALFDDDGGAVALDACGKLESLLKGVKEDQSGDAASGRSLAEMSLSTFEANQGWPTAAWREMFCWGSMFFALLLDSTDSEASKHGLEMLDRAFVFTPPGTAPMRTLQCLASLLEPPMSAEAREERSQSGTPLFPDSQESIAELPSISSVESETLARCSYRRLPAIPEVRFPIDEIDVPSFEARVRQMPRVPCIARGAAKQWGWSAFQRWRDGLVSSFGHRLIPIEYGSACGGELPREEFIRLGDFCKMFAAPPDPVPYLAQHCLFDQLFPIRQDFEAPPFLSDVQIFRVNGWLGPRGTITELHTDTCNNFFVQVQGFKYVRLYSPEENENLYASSDASSNFSPITCEREQIDEYPNVRHARYTEAILGPGDCLYLPAYTWHYLRSLSPSFSLNFWLNDDEE